MFTQNSNMYKHLSTKLVLSKIRTYRTSFCFSNKAPEIRNALTASFHKLMNKTTLKKILNYLLPLHISVNFLYLLLCLVSFSFTICLLYILGIYFICVIYFSPFNIHLYNSYLYILLIFIVFN